MMYACILVKHWCVFCACTSATWLVSSSETQTRECVEGRDLQMPRPATAACPTRRAMAYLSALPMLSASCSPTTFPSLTFAPRAPTNPPPRPLLPAPSLHLPRSCHARPRSACKASPTRPSTSSCSARRPRQASCLALSAPCRSFAAPRLPGAARCRASSCAAAGATPPCNNPAATLQHLGEGDPLDPHLHMFTLAVISLETMIMDTRKVSVVCSCASWPGLYALGAPALLPTSLLKDELVNPSLLIVDAPA